MISIENHGGPFGGGKDKQIPAKDLITTNNTTTEASIVLKQDTSGTSQHNGSACLRLGMDSKFYYVAFNAGQQVHKIDRKTGAWSAIAYSGLVANAVSGMITVNSIVAGTVVGDGNIVFVFQSGGYFYVGRIDWGGGVTDVLRVYYLQTVSFGDVPRVVKCGNRVAIIGGKPTAYFSVGVVSGTFTNASTIQNITTTMPTGSSGGGRIMMARYNEELNRLGIVAIGSSPSILLIDLANYTQWSLTTGSFTMSSSNEFQRGAKRTEISHDFNELWEWYGTTLRCMDLKAITPRQVWTTSMPTWGEYDYNLVLRKNGMLLAIGTQMLREFSLPKISAASGKVMNFGNNTIRLQNAGWSEEYDVAYHGLFVYASGDSQLSVNAYWTVDRK